VQIVSSKRVVLVTLVATVVLLVAAGAWLGLRPGSAGGDPQAAARTSFPDLQPADGPPTLANLVTLDPAPGTVVEAAGPFDDRYRLQRLRFDGRTVSGTARITSDVSDILELETLAAFYDRNGALLGTARDVYHLDESTVDHAHEGAPEETHRFSIRVPAELQGRAVSAAVGIPVLVNE
jgi:hypothetical protein